MSVEFMENKPSNYSATIKLEGLQIDFWTNGPHECVEDMVAHTHTGYELQAALSGKYCLAFPEDLIQVSPPDTVCLIPPDCPHRSCQPEVNTRLISLQFSFRKKALQGEAAALADILERQKQPILLTGIHDLYRTICQFGQELLIPGYASQLLLDAILRQLYVHVLRSVKNQMDSHNHRSEEDLTRKLPNNRYSQIESFFQENYTKSVTENDLAQILAVSKRQTSRILQNQFGKTFHEKLEDIRMYYAQRYLQQSDITVENVAFYVGYTSAAGFFVAFKRRFGMTPTEYRRTAR